MVAKYLQSKDTTPISHLEAGLSLGLAFGPLGAIFELLKHMGLQSMSIINSPHIVEHLLHNLAMLICLSRYSRRVDTRHVHSLD